MVDQTFHDQTADNEERFRAFPATRRLFLRGGHLPRVGTRFRNPDLADTYDLIARRGPRAFYDGRLSGEIVDVVRRPPKTASTDLPVPPGYLTRYDLAGYQALDQDDADHEVGYRGYDVYGMAPSSSGGTTVGEALNILERLRPVDDERRRRAAPLPRGQRPGLRRPGDVRRRPGVRRRAAGGPALAGRSPTSGAA